MHNNLNIFITMNALHTISLSFFLPKSQAHSINILHHSCLRFLLLPTLRHRIILCEIQAHAINTMSLIRRCIVPLALEYMPKMAPTVTANDLRPLHPERAVRMPCHGARDAVEVCGPSAAGREFVGGFVEGRVAGRAGVDALSGLVFVEFAGEGGFGALFAEDAELF
jgi:hypothetical protein